MFQIRTEVFNRIEVWGIRWPLQNGDVGLGEKVFDYACSVDAGVVLLKNGCC